MSRLHSWIYRAGIAWRNPRIPQRLELLLQTQSWDLQRLRDRQLVMLRELVAWAYTKSPYYRALFDQHGLAPGDIQRLDDLVKIPPLEKQVVLDQRDELQVEEIDEPLFYSETSGSTGTPLVFYRNADWDAWHNASVMRGYSWYGVEPWQRNGYLWGFNFSPRQKLKTRLLDGLQNRFRMFSYDDREIRHFASMLRQATYLGGYSSMIYEIAKAINQSPDIEPLTNLKLLRGTSEKIFDRYQVEATKAFGRRITSEYGAAESGIIAFECPAGAMHINMETCIVEVENQEILVTNLVSRSFPIIRYRLGDYIKCLPESQCDCGMKHPIISEVTGRVGQKIQGSGRAFPSLTLYYVFKNLAQQRGLVLNYQAVQEVKGELRLDLEQSLCARSRAHLLEEVQKYFGSELAITIRENIDLRSQSRKRRDFVSRLDELSQLDANGSVE